MSEFSTIFIHIPKTAGTTLRAIIENVYDKNKTFYIYPGNIIDSSMEHLISLPDETKRKYKLFCGHMNFGLHRHIHQPCRYITILRDPVAYTISMFNHLMQEENGRTDKFVSDFQHRFKGEKNNLADFFAKGMTTDVDNKMTRVLSGESPAFGQCRRDMLGVAKRNLREHFAVAGFTERFDESVVLFQKILGWPTPFYIKQNISKKNQTRETCRRKPSISSGVILNWTPSSTGLPKNCLRNRSKNKDLRSSRMWPTSK